MDEHLARIEMVGRTKPSSSIIHTKCHSTSFSFFALMIKHVICATLERDYTILTNPMVTGSLCSGSTGNGPLAVGPRRLTYGASPVVVSNYGRVSPQHLTTSAYQSHHLNWVTWSDRKSWFKIYYSFEIWISFRWRQNYNILMFQGLLQIRIIKTQNPKKWTQ